MVIEIIAILFVILFLYTAISKLMDYALFTEQLATSPWLAPLADLIAPGLPVVEFAVLALLIIPKWRLYGFYSSLLLMCLFTGYVIAILLYNDQLPCSCGGIMEELTWPQHIIINTVFILLASLGIIFERKRKKMERITLTGAGTIQTA
jgi:uncharacterized membrane protein YphA (DoxX/SURF4 family)